MAGVQHSRPADSKKLWIWAERSLARYRKSNSSLGLLTAGCLRIVSCAFELKPSINERRDTRDVTTLSTCSSRIEETCPFIFGKKYCGEKKLHDYLAHKGPVQVKWIWVSVEHCMNRNLHKTDAKPALSKSNGKGLFFSMYSAHSQRNRKPNVISFTWQVPQQTRWHAKHLNARATRFGKHIFHQDLSPEKLWKDVQKCKISRWVDWC